MTWQWNRCISTDHMFGIIIIIIIIITTIRSAAFVVHPINPIPAYTVHTPLLHLRPGDSIGWAQGGLGR